MHYQRRATQEILKQLHSAQNLLQVVIGPRQVGKTTAALQIRDVWQGGTWYASADDPLPPGPEWVVHHWQMARREKKQPVLLILDEVQKVRGWSEAVKSLWDEERRQSSPCKVLLLGSSSLLLQKGLSESLSGRFFLHRFNHWSFKEVQEAFSLSLEEWLFFGGYPGALALRHELATWKAYVVDSLIETVLNKDIFQLQNIAKPALFRHLFLLAARYPAEILSYNKMLGQLHDAGNTTTLAHYLHLLSSAFLVTGLECYKLGERPKRGSSPKLIIRNNALVNALTNKKLEDVRTNPEHWGHLVENAVGAYLLNSLSRMSAPVYYWRSHGAEVDFVIQTAQTVWAIEVKSGRMRQPHGLEKFLALKKGAMPFIIGGSGMPLEDFFSRDPAEIFL